ncbi:fumarylacetoacetate hydrolase family protein [Ramlibacter monticola]|uniref:Fumarylacetoacetate hydrolase family protein n=1 Tax=Ramlibacter monticola TaxID=1926872 RepID=A0A937CY10_9BURK|nr:fumarylacetoacetate hydrolase family protein [Ramlibacter monticola]MBL0394667.1 fumarylacetoacetate hydrolase family protein [Ramlibacter monticola]
MTEPAAGGVETVARALLEAWREERPVDAARLADQLKNAEDGYAVQESVARASNWFDRAVPQHWKSGGPTREAVLTHAALPPRRVWTSPADGSGSHFNMRLIEAEVALRLARDVAPAQAAALSHEEAGSLVDAMCVSIEIVDSRWREARTAPALLKLADLQSHGALVLGEWKPYAARDWSRQGCVVRIGGAEPRSFQGTHSLGDPAWLLPTWLRHVTRQGATVPKGTVVTTGTWCGMLEAQRGDKVRAEFEGIGAAEVQL